MKMFGVRLTRKAGVNANEMGIIWLDFTRVLVIIFIALKSSNAAK